MPSEFNKDCQTARPYRLETKLQNYPWGTSNEGAFIPELLGITPESGQTYAEMWMGVHPNGPSSIIDLERGPLDMANWLSEHPEERLSKEHHQVATNGLPYLLKVLSAAEALSIQSHPNKLQAQVLHKADPAHYPDDNHKPEVAIALDHLDALVGFISDEKLIELLEKMPELFKLLQNHSTGRVDVYGSIQTIFQLWESQPALIAKTSDKIYSRLSAADNPDETETLFMEQYLKRGAKDIGLIFLFFLNRVHLEAGEAIFLAPGVPHAYLKGNIVECMANSDNVVRLGLTDKFCDAKALKEILVFDEGKDYRISRSREGTFTNYDIPVSEFKIRSLQLPDGETQNFSSRTSLTMFLLTEGEICIRWGDESQSCTCVIKRGTAFITPANLEDFKIISREDSNLYLVELP